MFHDDYNDISDISKILLQGIWIPPVKTRVITSPSSLSLRLWKPFLQPHCFLFCLFSRPQLVYGACQIPLKHCAFGCSRLIKAPLNMWNCWTAQQRFQPIWHRKNASVMQRSAKLLRLTGYTTSE